jgi:hypothetical protein
LAGGRTGVEAVADTGERLAYVVGRNNKLGILEGGVKVRG